MMTNYASVIQREGIVEQQGSVSRRAVVSGASVGVASLVLPRAAMASSEVEAEAAFFAAPPGENFGYYLSLDASDTTQGGSVSLAWEWSDGYVAGGFLYQVLYRSTSPAGQTYTVAGSTDQRSFVVTGLVNGTPYEFAIQASDGASSYSSNNSFATPTLALPGTPQNLSAVPGGTGELVVAWDAPSTGGPATTYTVEYRIGSSGSYSTQVVNVPTETVTLTGLTNGSAYEVRVFASNATGGGTPTAAVTATPLASTVETLEAPEPQPPVVAVQSTWTTIDVITDRNVGSNSNLTYEYSFNGDAGSPSWTSMSSWSGVNVFTGIDISGRTAGSSFNVWVRKTGTINSTPVNATSRVTLIRKSDSYQPGSVYALVNNSGDTRLTSVQVTARGGRGGTGGNDGSRTGGAAGVPGQVVATVALAASERLFVSAGGSGGNGASGVSRGTAAPLGGTTARSIGGTDLWSAGYGGGNGGITGRYGTSGQGGAGGGASVVARGATASTASVVVVAGGAGGGGGAEENNGGGGYVLGGTTGGGNTGSTFGGTGQTYDGDRDDVGGGGGGGGGSVGGVRGTTNRTSEYRPSLFASLVYRYTGQGASRGSNLVTGTGVTASTNDNATGTTTTGFVTIEYTETTAISPFPAS